jgi:hypothetical protein
MTRPSRTLASNGRGALEDLVTLANGDTVRGIITAIRDSSVSIQSSGGDSTEISLDSIVQVEFASVAGAQTLPEATERAFRVSLADATTIVATSLHMRGPQLELSFADGSARSIPVSMVASIEQINGPVIWLSSRRAIENVQIPFLDMAAPARMNLSCGGLPIRFGQRTFSRGIGVHSYSRMVWSVDPAYKAFRTQYAMDGQLPYADVTVRIRLDEQVAHEQEHFRAGNISPLIVLDTNGARTVTLEVDYGESYDVQDRFNWIEPALLKTRPPPPAPIAPPPASTAPTTTPATAPP